MWAVCLGNKRLGELRGGVEPGSLIVRSESEDVSQGARYPSLQGASVLITGGATGIGAAFVRLFAGQGSRVGFLDIDDEAARKLCDDLRRHSATPPLYRHCDLRDIVDLRKAVQEIEEQLGGVRVLINNAANDDRHTLDEVEPEYFDDRIAVNLRHQFFAAQAVRAGMAGAGGGAIINLSSITWRLGYTGLPVYATAKAGILGLTKTLARELGPEQIRVNCIEPGFVATERQKRLWVTPEYEKKVQEVQALPGFCQPEDVAHLGLFLASDESRMITGQTFIIDGGWT